MVYDRMVANALREKGREGQEDDEDNEEIFILDPSVLTVQELSVQLNASKILVACAVCYSDLSATSPSLSSSSSSSIPSLSSSSSSSVSCFSLTPVVMLELTGLRASALASNNPWIGR